VNPKESQLGETAQPFFGQAPRACATRPKSELAKTSNQRSLFVRECFSVLMIMTLAQFLLKIIIHFVGARGQNLLNCLFGVGTST